MNTQMNTQANKRIRVVVCDDHALFRNSVKSFLNAQPDIEVVGEAADGKEGLARAVRLHPDVVLMDVSMPVLQGFDATRRIKKARPDTKVLMLTAYDDEDTVGRCLDAGASGYLLKDSVPTQWIYAVKAACRGEQYISPRVVTGLVKKYVAHSEDFTTDGRLLSKTRTRRAGSTC